MPKFNVGDTVAYRIPGQLPLLNEYPYTVTAVYCGAGRDTIDVEWPDRYGIIRSAKHQPASYYVLREAAGVSEAPEAAETPVEAAVTVVFGNVEENDTVTLDHHTVESVLFDVKHSIELAEQFPEDTIITVKIKGKGGN